MKLKTKMKVAFIIMAVLPIVLCVLALIFVVKREVSEIKKIYNIPSDFQFWDLYSPGVLLGGITDGIYESISETARTVPQRLEDPGYIEDLDSELSSKLSSLVIRRGDETLYSSGTFDEAQLKELLPDISAVSGLGDAGIYKGGKYQMLVRAVVFKDGSGRDCAAYILTSMRQTIPQIKTISAEIFLIIIAVLVITALLLYFWINKSVVRPIDRLRLGTQNIKNGNLDFEIKSTSGDEFGDLYQDFDDMRLRLKKSEDEKERSDVEEKELIRNISHDLKTPLTAIKGYVEGLRDGIADTPEKQQKYVITIANKVEDMDRLIDELTLFSRLDTNRIPYDMIRLNVKGYFDDCVDELRVDLEARESTLNYAFHGDDSIETIADPNQIKRVINNIVSNSIKYKSPDRPCVIGIAVFDEGDYIHVEMSDNGKGINMKDLPRIFDRFYRTDESRTSPQSGSGIGLAIVKKIIEDHKGRIWVDSVEGEGTTFHINLLRYREGTKLSLPDNQIKTRKEKKRRKGGSNE